MAALHKLYLTPEAPDVLALLYFILFLDLTGPWKAWGPTESLLSFLSSCVFFLP